MGQNASQSAQDASKPEISGPMPLRNGGPSPSRQQRSASGETNRLRRERRRSRDQTNSVPTSPISDSSSRSTAPVSFRAPPETQPSAPAARRDSTATTATAPPPYTSEPVGHEIQLAEAPPPPVPPRDYNRSSSSSAHRRSSGARMEKSGLLGIAEQAGSHRRTQSHSHSAGPSSARAGSGTGIGAGVGGGSGATRRPMPPLISSPVGSVDGSGVGGFRIDMGEAPDGMGVLPERAMSGEQAKNLDRRTRTQPRKSVDTVVSHPPPGRRGSKEDPLELLRRYKTVMIVDDSSSMEGVSWAEAREALAGLADVAGKYDQEGIDVHFLNNTRVGTNIRNGVEVKRLFDYVRPQGITPTGEKLEELLLAYMDRLELERSQYHHLSQVSFNDPDAPTLPKPFVSSIKPVNFIVITDGAPTDDPESVIVSIARRLDAGHFPLMQVGIQFVQIGTAEDTAEALKAMDDELANVHGIRDIVDTTPYTGSEFNTELLVKILLGGINRRVDRLGAASVI